MLLDPYIQYLWEAFLFQSSAVCDIKLSFFLIYYEGVDIIVYHVTGTVMVILYTYKPAIGIHLYQCSVVAACLVLISFSFLFLHCTCHRSENRERRIEDTSEVSEGSGSLGKSKRINTVYLQAWTVLWKSKFINFIRNT